MFCNCLAIRSIYTNIDYSIKGFGRNHTIKVFSIGANSFGFITTDCDMNLGRIASKNAALNV